MPHPITIPVYFNTPQTDQAEKLGMDRKMDDADVRNVTFYRIAAVSIYKEDGKVFGRIYCNGEEFVSPWKADKINEAIKSANQ